MTLLDLAARVADFDHVDPLNEASIMALRAELSPRVEISLQTPDGLLVGAAYAPDDAPVEVLVDPRFRRGGLGRRLVETAMAEGETQFWAHGDLPAASKIARRVGLKSVRTLLVLRLSFDRTAPTEQVPPGVTLRTYQPSDAEAVVAINARAFADHPEQGAMDLTDLERRMASDWFDPAGLFLAERDGQIIGFHWTKLEQSPTEGLIGEVYVVGIDPPAQGGGLGTALTARGLRHLHESGARVVDLYVEGDNAAALTVYRRLGFADHAKDVLYARS